jgi:hypothetical protein
LLGERAHPIGAWKCERHPPKGAPPYFLRFGERLLPPEREPLDRDDPFLLDLEERDRAEVDRELLERFAPEREDDFRVVGPLAVERLAVDRRVVLEPPEPDFLVAADRFVVVVLDPRELELLVADGGSGAGAGVAGGALAAAVRARALATATSGSTPSSRSAMTAPTAIATAAASPRKMPILRSPGLAKKRQRMISTLSVPSAAVTPPRGTGMFTR